MEQHKPKSRIIQSDLIDSESSAVAEEPVIIHQPEDEQEIQVNQRVSMLVSFVMRLVGLAFSYVLAVSFARHYPGGQPLFTHIESRPVSTETFIFAAALIYIAFGMVRRIREDRVKPLSILNSNWIHMFGRAILIYLLWTFLFFVFSFLGNSGFTLIFAGFILISVYDMPFKDRKTNAIQWNITTTNRRF